MAKINDVLVLVGEIKGITQKNNEQIDALFGKVDEVGKAFAKLPCAINTKAIEDLEAWTKAHNNIIKDAKTEKNRARTNVRVGLILAGFGLLCSSLGVGIVELVNWLKMICK